MKSGKYLNGILQTMFEKVGMSEDVEPFIDELRTNISERDKHLSGFSETWDDSADDVKFVPKEAGNPTDDWESKYNELKSRYINRFFNGDESASNAEEKTSLDDVKREQNADIHKDGEVPSIEELFSEVE